MLIGNGSRYNLLNSSILALFEALLDVEVKSKVGDLNTFSILTPRFNWYLITPPPPNKNRTIYGTLDYLNSLCNQFLMVTSHQFCIMLLLIIIGVNLYPQELLISLVESRGQQMSQITYTSTFVRLLGSAKRGGIFDFGLLFFINPHYPPHPQGWFWASFCVFSTKRVDFGLRLFFDYYCILSHCSFLLLWEGCRKQL